MKKCNFALALTGLLFIIVASAQGSDKISTKIDALVDSLIKASPVDLRGKRLAVIPFDGSRAQDNSQAGIGVSERIIVSLQRYPSIERIDRTNFQKALNEIALSQSDVVDEETVVKVGMLVAAEYLLVGQVVPLLGRLQIAARIMHTETARIVSAASVSVSSIAFDSFIEDVFRERNQLGSSVFRSTLVPGWGQFYTGHAGRGAVSLTICAGSLGYMLYSLFETTQAKQKKDEHIETGKSQQADTWSAAQISEYDKKSIDLYDDYSAKYDRTVYMGLITGGLWTLNIIDAIIAGIQAKRDHRLYFSCSWPGYGHGHLAVGIRESF